MPRSCELLRWVATTRPEHQGPVSNVAASHQRFIGNPSPLVSGAPWWDTSSALAAAADAVDRRRLSKPSSPSLFQPLVSGAADLVSLSRRDKLGVSYGVKVPVGQGLATHPYRALGPWRSQAEKSGEQDGLSVGRASCRP
jgi:hypothetical protein